MIVGTYKHTVSITVVLGFKKCPPFKKNPSFYFT